MQTFDCHGDWLIDYADGALPHDQHVAAEQHLAQCPACQREVDALATSGARLTSYFEVIRRTEQCSVPGIRFRWNVIAQRAAAVAACVALMALGHWLNRQANSSVRPQNIAQYEAPREAIEFPNSNTNHDDIAAEIARETQIARLKAAIAILKEEPGMSERSDALKQYLSQMYQVDYELPSM